MLTLIAQFDRHSGPDSVGSHKLTFAIDESIDSGSFNPMKIKKGTQYVLVLVECTDPEANELISETPEQTKDRFQKRMHAQIAELAKYRDISSKEMKELFKKNLIKLNLIKESTTELDLAGLARAINILQQKIDEASTT